MSQPVAFSRPTLGVAEIDEVVESIRSGWITSGPKVARFEAMFRDRLGVREAVAVNSATAGLHLALAALDVGPGDEVIVPSITWAATANVVELCGARPVFADVDPDTLCIDPADVERRTSERTRAIVPVHFAGQSADLDALRAIASASDALVLHDAAHALGTTHRETEIGATGEITVFSFHPIKNITTGEGGMITLADTAIADRLRCLRFHGVSRDAWTRYRRGGPSRYDVVEPGWKYNMLDLQAALGIHQFARLDEFNASRRRLAEHYDRAFSDVPEVTPLRSAGYPTGHSWHLYVVRVDIDALALDRDAFMAVLDEAGIATGLHFPPLHLSSYYSCKYGYRHGDLPVAEQLGERIVSLPLYPTLSADEQRRVIDSVRRVVEEART